MKPQRDVLDTEIAEPATWDDQTMQNAIRVIQLACSAVKTAEDANCVRSWADAVDMVLNGEPIVRFGRIGEKPLTEPLTVRQLVDDLLQFLEEMGGIEEQHATTNGEEGA